MNQHPGFFPYSGDVAQARDSKDQRWKALTEGTFPVRQPARTHMPGISRLRAALVLFLFTLGLGAPLAPLAHAQPVRAQTDAATTEEDTRPLTGKPDRKVIAAGETFNYVLTLADGQGRTPPNLNPLLENFEIVDRRRTSKAAMENGRPVHMDQWVMTLLPKRTGTLTIPPLTVGNQTSQAERVQVIPTAAVDVKADTPLFVRLTTGAGPAFAQSDIPVTIRIYDRVGMMRGAMEKPVAEGATFVQDGDQRHYLKTINNQRYRVLEQSYLMRPQRSGTIEIQPLTLDATVPGPPTGNDGDRNMAALLGRGTFTGQLPPERNITVKSLPVKVEVEPRPADATGWFLPARAVLLHEEWSSPPQKVKVGTVLTRTITLEAQGATPNQLPPLQIQPVDGVRQYEDKGETDTAWINGEMGAQLVKEISVMPTRPGSFTLPAMDVHWWNLVTQKQEVTRLPAVTISAEGDVPAVSSAAVGAASPPNQPSSAPPPPPSTLGGTDNPMVREMIARTIAYATDALHVARAHLPVVIVGGLILAGLILWRRRMQRARRRLAEQRRLAQAPRRVSAPALAPPSAEEAVTALEKACKANDAVAAHAAYLVWVRRLEMDGKAMGHPALAPQGEMAQALGDLRTQLYGGAPGQWHGKGFFSTFRKACRPARTVRRGGGAVLAPLYPRAQ